MCLIAIHRKETIKLKGSMEGLREGLEGGKGKGECNNIVLSK